ncbi:DUF4263 domain-containing protein [Pantoea agglomerans]|uniref:Shedu immune nuclease family protein n=1 Tax=Enterobacter agglomerans TaxID=549 RepID=UPI0013975AED|nr:Shedu immune nuclease family protein [Pantoea agglomerans]QIA51049.1 DUF4263 domain-containing protein [Pantoea agglomerans]
MISFINNGFEVVFKYEAENNEPSWVWTELEKYDLVNISKVFYFYSIDLINPPENNESFEDYSYEFRFGTINGDYIVVPGHILGIDNDLHISKNTVLNRKFFAAERNVSIFGRLAKILNHSDPIVIGGSSSTAIPSNIFGELLKKFPTTYEVDRYADARVHTILAQYLDGMKDVRGRYEAYVQKNTNASIKKLDLDLINKLEVEKYTLIKDLIEDALKTKAAWSEKQWQQLMIQFLLLLFPKYILVLENVTIHDYYSNQNKKTNRFIDIGLVDSNGNLDVIEVKKPFDDKILSRNEYRGNNIPTAELSGSIMQAEKYLFHLSKWGAKGEALLSKKYESQLPIGMSIKISNPKAIIIVGRDQIGGSDMTTKQQLDFEIIKRKYTNMMDIITYDDLLRRLNRTIAALEK